MPWYHKLVDRYFGNQAVVEHISQSPSLSEVSFTPFVTVSRDPGSGGKPIAQLVAKRLGFKFYNRKLIDEISKSANMRSGVMEDIDEKQRNQVEDLIHNILNPEYISERRYIKHLCKVVLSLAHKGKAVILGRGSNFITPNAFGLHVRITAPYRVCVSRAVQYEHVPYEKAREIIKEVMSERAGFVKQYFGKDIANSKYYDLTLNTTFMSMEDAANIIVTAFHRKFPHYKKS